MSEKIKKNEKAKKQTWRAGNMLYPVPAVMVSCARKGEKPNIITVAWAGTVCSDPAMVSISVRKERYSHSSLTSDLSSVLLTSSSDISNHPASLASSPAWAFWLPSSINATNAVVIILVLGSQS